VLVIGGGIAGVSAAAALALRPEQPRVRLIEAEEQLAQHTTGRSAAQLIENLGAAPIRALTLASRPAFDGFLTPRSLLTVGRADQSEVIDDLLADGLAHTPSIREITVAEAQARFPPLRAEGFERAMLEPDSADIDVAGLHQRFVQQARAAGTDIDRSTALVSAESRVNGWTVQTTSGELRADVLVDCAGAWGDVVAQRCGIAPIGLQALRRTAFMVAVPAGSDSGGWPLVADADHHWYCKPDGAQLLCSPGDENPSEPCDARPEEVDVALAIDRINAATTLDIRSVRSSWAGLRTFSPDRSMVIGPDGADPTFVWCVGQGGTGIQTAPAAGWLTADLTIDGEPGTRFAAVDLDATGLAPDRFGPRTA